MLPQDTIHKFRSSAENKLLFYSLSVCIQVFDDVFSFELSHSELIQLSGLLNVQMYVVVISNRLQPIQILKSLLSEDLFKIYILILKPLIARKIYFGLNHAVMSDVAFFISVCFVFSYGDFLCLRPVSTIHPL